MTLTDIEAHCKSIKDQGQTSKVCFPINTALELVAKAKRYDQLPAFAKEAGEMLK